MSPFALAPKRRAGLALVSEAIRFNDTPRFVPSEMRAGRRYSVPPKPDLASQMLPKAFFAALVSWRQQAWSLTTQSIAPSASFCQRYSTSARGRIGGFTLASTPAFESVSSIRWPIVTSRRKSMWGNSASICSAASSAFLELRWSRLMFGSALSEARYAAMKTARPSECGGGGAWGRGRRRRGGGGRAPPPPPVRAHARVGGGGCAGGSGGGVGGSTAKA